MTTGVGLGFFEGGGWVVGLEGADGNGELDGFVVVVVDLGLVVVVVEEVVVDEALDVMVVGPVW